MDADGVTLACATAAEVRAARRAGAPAALVGLGAANGIPGGPLVSFGLAGALRDDLAAGTVLDATRVVDADGAVLWEGGPLGADGAEPGTILAGEALVDDPAERRRLHERTGADAVDLESGPLARTGRLRGILRAVSDTPSQPLNGIATGVKRDGSYDWPALARAFARHPRGFVRTARTAKHALGQLERSWAR
jgi:hypothetical protein